MIMVRVGCVAGDDVKTGERMEMRRGWWESEMEWRPIS